jgi:hypothetical protein
VPPERPQATQTGGFLSGPSCGNGLRSRSDASRMRSGSAACCSWVPSGELSVLVNFNLHNKHQQRTSTTGQRPQQRLRPPRRHTNQQQNDETTTKDYILGSFIAKVGIREALRSTTSVPNLLLCTGGNCRDDPEHHARLELELLAYPKKE